MKEHGKRFRVRERFEDPTLLALKKEEGATSKGMQVASRSWKREGNVFLPRASERNTSLPTL